MAPRVHVLIVGAGPTGLALALVLRRHGIGYRLVDKAAGPPGTSRALAIQPRTLELLDALGVGAPILARGVRLRALNVHAHGRRIACFSLAGLDSRHDYIVSLGQSETERVLAARLADLGAAPERSIELVRFGQDGGGVRAILRHEAGREETQACDWLIGCDGAHSAVRHALGLDFQGARYEDDFRLADVRIDWPLPHDEVHVFLRPRGPLASIPLPGGLHRLVAIVPGRGRGEGLAPTLSFFQEFARDAAPPGTRVSDATWLASFRVHRRMVNRYRIGRVLLAGDAAHIHSPAGGQGMNIGIHDAVNLGWKLALVAAGRADERLLDSYEAERLPIARAVLRATNLATRLILWRGPLAHAARAAVARRVLGRSRVASRLAPAIAGLAVAYTRSPIVEGRTRAIAAGARVPDVRLARTNGTSVRLSDVLDASRHCLLLMPGREEAPLREIAATTRQYWSEVLMTLWISASADADGPPAGVATLLDSSGVLREALGAPLALVRPDGYLGYVSRRADPGALERYLARLFAALSP